MDSHQNDPAFIPENSLPIILRTLEVRREHAEANLRFWNAQLAATGDEMSDRERDQARRILGEIDSEIHRLSHPGVRVAPDILPPTSNSIWHPASEPPPHDATVLCP
jgi:hypothetical protein